jgi:hypothetical protein
MTLRGEEEGEISLDLLWGKWGKGKEGEREYLRFPTGRWKTWDVLDFFHDVEVGGH